MSCENEVSFVCQSIDYNPSEKICILSSHSTVDASSYLANGTVNSKWTFSEWTCGNGTIIHVVKTHI